ncbi:glycerol kinase [Micromonospora citrea]|uniref:Glycerol kinase n=1 Tax=Micromonospora citrea TaxID=47855 RepID=A0A1C6TS31_9ACTN|nr:glycerol kinase GlpK [Micromonospora citrea]SCL44478.1 glycerol kinase [Micromonospora citrea]
MNNAVSEGLVLAVDQGTTSTRALLVDADCRVVTAAQVEHRQHFPRPGWVEHDADEIWANTRTVIADALDRAGCGPAELAAVGITNQRETVVVWDRRSGRSIHRAIVWQDTRTEQSCRQLAGPAGPDRYRSRTGLPLSTYVSAPKIRWILDHVPGAREAAERGDLAAGTIDSWLVWNLTGGVDGGLHVTDVTNASRTMLMDLATVDWDADLAAELGVPLGVLPDIRASSGVVAHGHRDGPLPGVPVGGILGDQQAALFGQARFAPGEAKGTYGTGAFVLLNTGSDPVPSKHGLITTVAYQCHGHDPVYALEGSIAVTGALVQWLRDNLGIIQRAEEVEVLARQVDDNGGVYVVPAFSGLFAPHWRPDARGTIVGLTRYADRRHLARAALEATALQIGDVLEAMRTDTGLDLRELPVDGGMAANDLLLQIQADQLGIPVVRPENVETTAMGAAYAAGLAVGIWSDLDTLRRRWRAGARFPPTRDLTWRLEQRDTWRAAVSRSLNWTGR